MLKTRHTYALRLLLVLVLSLQGANLGCDTGGGITMGAALLASFNKAGDLIRQARSAGNDLLLGVGIEIQSAITAAQLAYEDSLDKTMTRLNEQERKVVTDIDFIIQTAIDKGAQEAHLLLNKTQLIANTLPFANKIPQVSGYSPHFLEPRGDTFQLQVSGNFPFGFSEDEAPFIEIAGQNIKAKSYGTTALMFAVPKNLCAAAVANAIGACDAKVSIPWDASRWYHVFGRKIKQGVFNVQVGILPTSPGTLKLTHNKAGEMAESQAKFSDPFLFDSHADDIEENRALRLSEAEIIAGWRIVPGSGRFELVQHIEGSEGHDWYNKGFQGGNDREIVWRARTEHKTFGSSGKIRWRIACTIARKVPTSTAVAEDIPVTWSMSRIFSLPAGSWKLTWTRFDGAVSEINRTDLSSKLLTVEATGDSFKVNTYGEPVTML